VEIHFRFEPSSNVGCCVSNVGLTSVFLCLH